MDRYITIRAKLPENGEPDLVSITSIKKKDGITHTFYSENKSVSLTEDEKKMFNIVGGPTQNENSEEMMDELAKFLEVDYD